MHKISVISVNLVYSSVLGFKDVVLLRFCEPGITRTPASRAQVPLRPYSVDQELP